MLEDSESATTGVLACGSQQPLTRFEWLAGFDGILPKRRTLVYSLPVNKFGLNLAMTLVVGGALAETVTPRLSAMKSPLGGIGLFLLLPGFILWTIARFQLGRSFTVSAQAVQLVNRGLYSRIRNPVYVFGSCVIAGLILFLGRPLWLLVFVIIIPVQIWRVGKEAQVLEARFGDAYRAYRASTWF